MGALAGAGLLVVAAVLLVVGAELFVENLGGAARRLGLTVLATAVLLAGAEPEEALTGILASAAGRPGLAAGDAVGANVTLLTAALGLAALARPLPVGRRVREYGVGACAAGLLAVAVLLDGVVGRIEGVVLLAGYAGLVALVWRRDRRPPAIGELAELEDDDEGHDGRRGEDGGAVAGRAGRALLLVVLGLVVMTAGGALAVEGAVRLVDAAGRGGPGESAVGLTALALATTAELFALAAAAARRGVPEVAVAALAGSAVYNATVSLAAAALVAPLPVPDVLPAAVLAALLPLVVVLLARRHVLGRRAGGVLVLAYVAYVAYVATVLRAG